MIASLFQHSSADRPPLRIGLLLDTPSLPRCQADVLDHITRCDFASIALAVFDATVPPATGPDDRAPAVRRWPAPSPLYRLYQRWDRRNLRPTENPLARVDCATVLAGVETMTMALDEAGAAPPAALDRIRQANLDVLIRFGFGPLHGDILTAARYGVWAYRYGASDEPGGPTYFWEMRTGRSLSLVGLTLKTDHPEADPLLALGVFATRPGLSQARSSLPPYWGAVTFVIQKLHELHERGWDDVKARLIPQPTGPEAPPASVSPTNADMVRWLGPLLPAKGVRRLGRRGPIVSHWRLGIRQSDRTLFDTGPQASLAGFQWINPPRGHFMADPFLIEEAGATWIFFENFDYGVDLGRLACAPIRPDGLLGDITQILERPYHLSYPCLVRDGGELYMIPESSGHGAVDLYRCRRFPDTWEFERELFKGRVVDTTVWVEDGRYWFFATLVDPRGKGGQLWLFSATSLTGTWTPHPASPLSTDVRNCRGAGAIFRDRGRLIRPAQDGSRGYGHRFTLNEIVTLTPDRFVERPYIAVDPPPRFAGTHTFSRLGRIEVIDGFRNRPLRKLV